jgi:hypothetical protein
MDDDGCVGPKTHQKIDELVSKLTFKKENEVEVPQLELNLCAIKDDFERSMIWQLIFYQKWGRFPSQPV